MKNTASYAIIIDRDTIIYYCRGCFFHFSLYITLKHTDFNVYIPVKVAEKCEIHMKKNWFWVYTVQKSECKMYTKPLKNTGLNVKAGKNGRSIRTRIETLLVNRVIVILYVCKNGRSIRTRIETTFLLPLYSSWTTVRTEDP